MTMQEGNMDWLINTPFLMKERGFFIIDHAIADGIFDPYTI
jgi:hypothetical protein